MKTIALALLLLLQAGPADRGVKVRYSLPTDGPLAVVDPKNPDWILSQFVAGAVRTVTAENRGRFTETWDGLDDHFMRLPPGDYGVKGIDREGKAARRETLTRRASP